MSILTRIEKFRSSARDSEPAPEQTTDIPPDERKLIEQINRLKRQAQEYRGSKRGIARAMTLQGEWIEAAERFMGNAVRASQSLAELEEGFRVYTIQDANATGATRGLQVTRIARTQNAVVAGVAATTAEPIRAMLSPVETGAGEVYWLTRKGRRRVRASIQTALSQIEAELEARSQMLDVAAAENIPAIPIDPQAADRADQSLTEQEAIEPERQRRTAEIMALHGDLTPEQIGEADDRGLETTAPTELIEEHQAERLQELVVAGVLPEEELIAVNDRFVARCAQELMDWMWDRANLDLHLMTGKLFCDIFGQVDFKFEWDHERRRFSVQPCHILNIYTDHTQIDMDLRSHHIETYQLTIEHAKTRWPQFADLLDQAKTGGGEGGYEHRIGGIYESGFDPDTMMVRVDVAYLRYEQVPMTAAEALERGLIVENDAGGYRLMKAEEGDESAVFAEVPTDPRRAGAWPMTSGILQVMTLPQINRVLSRRRCPYYDIPHAWALNIPRPDMSCFGIGEPIRARDIDDMINRVLSILGSLLFYYEFPCYFWPATVMEQVQRQGHSLFARPGANIPVPDDAWDRAMAGGGFDKMKHEGVQVPPSVISFLQMLIGLHDDIMQRADVMQGRAPYSGASGKVVESLAEQAMGPVAFKARFFEQAVERLCRLAIDAIGQWVEPRDAKRVLDRYEEPLIAEVLGRMRRAEYDVTVSLAAGRGAVQRQKENGAMIKHQQGLLSKRTTMTETGVEDPEREIKLITEEQQQLAQASAPVQAAAVDGLDAA